MRVVGCVMFALGVLLALILYGCGPSHRPPSFHPPAVDMMVAKDASVPDLATTPDMAFKWMPPAYDLKNADLWEPGHCGNGDVFDGGSGPCPCCAVRNGNCDIYEPYWSWCTQCLKSVNTDGGAGDMFPCNPTPPL